MKKAADLGLDREAALAGAAGVGFIGLPIPDRGVPASTKVVLARLAEASRALEAGKHVVVHCVVPE